MANNWTKEQQKAIDTDGCNILVSAAAGSGKTAVLVERIIRKVTNEEHPVDIDRMVIVTFTKAAAAEMKQRIREALDKLVEEDHNNERLQKQLTLINNAQITTIDSFCLNIIRNYFSDLDIDPGFRTADEGEVKLLENDVIGDMLEEYYEQADPAFLEFVDAYGKGRDDSAIIDIILKLYQFARSYPWPEEWLDECMSVYMVDSVEDMDQNPAVQYMMQYIRHRLSSFDQIYNELEEICNGSCGPSTYLPAIQSDHSGIKMLLGAQNFKELTRLIRLVSFDNLSRAKDKNASDELKNVVKAARDDYKKFITKKMKAGLFVKDAEGLMSDIKDNAASIQMMIHLAKDFSARMQKEKRDRNIVDFNDMEHMALNVLVHCENGELKDTEAAKALRDFYEEILIDEYQDSNMLQEVILSSISKGKENPTLNNIYMVGDVKQSIYKFRLACPELFIEKYNRYTSEDSPNIKIELQANFRSRANVLESTNDVFKRMMNPEYTGIEYDDKARLNPGADYPEITEGPEVTNGVLFSMKEDELESDQVLPMKIPGSTDIVLIESPAESEEDQANQVTYDLAEGSEEAETSEREAEAHTVAKMIEQLHEPGKDGKVRMVFDKNVPGGYRKIKYSDIVILTRTVTGWADVFVNTLMSHGIPAYSDASQGYFNVREIKLILNYMTIIDNPLQDIPMAAVMLSYFGRFDTEELTKIRMTDPNRHLYLSMKAIVEDQSEFDLEKIRHFLGVLEEFRLKAEILTIHDLLWEILYQTGYYNYVGTMPAGERRQANLDMLLEKAAAFEKTSYSGLFNFLKYIERIQKFNVDFGEACLLGENEDLVRVMSIHKSKGLEFPVVIVAGMGKKMNTMDARGEVVVDQTLGIGTNVYHLDQRIKNSTIIKQAISTRLIQDTISEELRVLYVAMTRAREKLIMTGYVKNSQKAAEGWKQKATEYLQRKSETFSYADLSSITTYFDMVMPVAYLPEDQNKGKFEILFDDGRRTNQGQDDDVLEKNEQTEQMDHSDQDEQLDQSGQTKQSEQTDQTDQDNLQEQSGDDSTVIKPYPYATTEVKKSKITVSELKKMQHDADMDENSMIADELKDSILNQDKNDNMIDQDQKIDQIDQIDQMNQNADQESGQQPETVSEESEYEVPQFMQQKQEVLGGSDRGTAYHRVMECLDYHQIDSIEVIESEIKNMVSDEKMSQTQADCIEARDIYQFCQSEIGKRVADAYLNGKVKREQPFIIGIGEGDQMQLVQGVIDLYIQEDDEITIVDYKTDRVRFGKAGEEELIKRYHIQLDYYAKALEQLTGLTVKQKIIYSFTLGKQILL